MGESSSPPRALAAIGGSDIKHEIYMRLMESGNEEVVSNPDFWELIDSHFSRLPPSYSLDVNIDKAEEVLLHQKILAEAKDPEKQPAFRVRFLKHEDVNLDARRDAEDIVDERHPAEAISGRQEAREHPVYEIIFSTVDKPKLLSQLSSLLSDIGLNIREAHVFSTTDGYSLDVFVVDGWPAEDVDRLQKLVEAGIAKLKGSGSAMSHQLAVDKILAVQQKVGDFEIDKNMLMKGEKIGNGSGSCGDMFHGSYLGQDVAIKFLRSDHLTETQGTEFAQEVLVLREVRHRNVVRFVGACTKPPEFCILTEYVPGGNLHDFLHKHDNILNLSQLLKFALDICNGMDYLHQNDIIHRDLKTANLLMDNNHVVKVADFGVARFQSQGGVMTAETGTYRWMAPEVMNHQSYNQKADVFSFGIVLWELATSKIPYATMTPLQAAVGVRKGLRPELPKNAHPRLVNLIQRCWETDPAKRPAFGEIKLELEELLKEVEESGETSRRAEDALGQA